MPNGTGGSVCTIYVDGQGYDLSLDSDKVTSFWGEPIQYCTTRKVLRGRRVVAHWCVIQDQGVTHVRESFARDAKRIPVSHMRLCEEYARFLGRSRASIYKMVNGQSYKNVPGPITGAWITPSGIPEGHVAHKATRTAAEVVTIGSLPDITESLSTFHELSQKYIEATDFVRLARRVYHEAAVALHEAEQGRDEAKRAAIFELDSLQKKFESSLDSYRSELTA